MDVDIDPAPSWDGMGSPSRFWERVERGMSRIWDSIKHRAPAQRLLDPSESLEQGPAGSETYILRPEPTRSGRDHMITTSTQSPVMITPLQPRRLDVGMGIAVGMPGERDLMDRYPGRQHPDPLRRPESPYLSVAFSGRFSGSKLEDYGRRRAPRASSSVLPVSITKVDTLRASTALAKSKRRRELGTDLATEGSVKRSRLDFSDSGVAMPSALKVTKQTVTPQRRVTGASALHGRSQDEILADMARHPLFRDKLEMRGLADLWRAYEGCEQRDREYVESIRRAEDTLTRIRAASHIYRMSIEMAHDLSADGSAYLLDEGAYVDIGDDDHDDDYEGAAENAEILKTVENPVQPLSPMLYKAQMRVLKHWARDSTSRQVLVEHRSIPIHGHDLARLRPGKWLNDEVINFYIEVLKDRQSRLGDAAKVKCHFFSTFMYAKLRTPRGYDYTAVQRWTRKIDVFALDRVLIPINIQNSHWALGMVDMVAKTVEYFDSLGFEQPEMTADILQWVVDEAEHKKQITLYTNDWTVIHHGDSVPQQTNTSDCGVFLCKFMDYLSLGKEFNFGAQHMPYFRRRLAHELLVKRVG
ncbi:putative ubiquitin-like-specific protease 1B [Porphyridium purpureum]|uniref:Putative ubiquitin-like-specific protease 1B n=1 Tax=Porphyridium purpureum TaxID=35688 RepID=A0A5J4Z8W4_PORPP|nr:putative ubiquitin-like-specific protease 1B [Porphyridium purpureum]|eukprot:POR3937..scf295_1